MPLSFQSSRSELLTVLTLWTLFHVVCMLSRESGTLTHSAI